MRWLFLAPVLALLAGCMRPPQPLAGDYANLTVADAQQGGYQGERVRWGGAIVETTQQSAETCFEILSMPLDARARPYPSDESYGRFTACSPGFYDPALFAPHREITVAGTLQEASRGKVGEYDYLFPRVAADAVYLWPTRPNVTYVYGDPYPYGWGWGGWGWGWGGVRVRHVH